jgi:hypothetical protein
MEEGGGMGGQKGRDAGRVREKVREGERGGDKGRGREDGEGGREVRGGTWTKERGGASLSAAIAVRASSDSGNLTKILRRQCPSMFCHMTSIY